MLRFFFAWHATPKDTCRHAHQAPVDTAKPVFLAGDAAISAPVASAGAAGLRVGAAAVDLEADDSMVIAGGITAGKATGQEGKLRAVAVVLAQPTHGKFAIVANDVLMLTRQ